MISAEYVDDIPKGRLERTRKAVGEAGGRALLIVHPHFPSQHNTINGYTKKEAAEYKDYIQKINSTMSKAKVPLIVLEGWESAEETEHFLRAIGQKALVIPTITGDFELRKRGKNYFMPREKDSAELIAILKKLGVRKVLCGGSLATREGIPAISTVRKIRAHEKKWLPEGKKPAGRPVSGGCMGTTYKNLILSGEFELIRLMPNLCFPHRPRYKRRQGRSMRRAAKPRRRK